jgi:hypothetical protein
MKKFLPPLYLLILAFLAYGLFFWQRGFYWDESPWSWIYFRLGPAMLTQTFSTSRPFWGMIYQVMLPLVGPYPARWQFLAIVIHWLAAVQVWWLVKQIWPNQQKLAFTSAALFLVYPGLGQNFLGLMYSHFYIVLNFLLLSFNLSLLAKSVGQIANLPRAILQIALLLLALLFSIGNLLAMEYFYFIELARVVMFWLTMRGETKRWQKTAFWSAPFVLTLISVTVWRAFFFENQNASYQFSLLADLKANPVAASFDLARDILRSFWATVPQAWASIFGAADESVLGPRTLAVVVAVLLAAGIGMGWVSARWTESAEGESVAKWEWFGLASVLWILGGGSLWVVGLVPELKFSFDRFTLPFMLGSSLMVAGLVDLLGRWRRVQIATLAILVGFSAAHFQQLDASFRHDWEVQRGFFNQMSWRIPGLKPETILLSNDLPVNYSSDNSLTGPLNWMYSPPGEMRAILYFASFRVGSTLKSIEPGLTHTLDYRGPIFRGNTSNILVVQFEPPGCFRVIDPEIESVNRLLPEAVRDAAPYTNLSVIMFEQEAVRPDQLYGAEPAHGWCYYFERADLARQMGDWDEVLLLSESAFALNDHPNDPVERFVFIEGYAHAGMWTEANQLSVETWRISKEYMSPMLCSLWMRIARETDSTPERDAVIDEMMQKFSCSP